MGNDGREGGNDGKGEVTYYPLSFLSTLFHHLPFFSSLPHTLSLSLFLILSPHPLFLSHSLSSPSSFFPLSFITPSLLSTLSHHPLLPPNPFSSPFSSFPPSFITPSFVSILSYHPLLSSQLLSSLPHSFHYLSVRKLFSCCMALSGMVKALDNLQVCY